MRVFRWRAAVTTGLLVVLSSVLDAGPPPPAGAARPVQQESSGDAPSVMLPNTRTGPPARPANGPFISHQVNVAYSGDNIIGDAANEPSIAADPRNPNRLVIGWRQFDAIESNFRQAGVAFTRDGGRNWRSAGPLDPGVFRSDPVLRADGGGLVYYYSLTIRNDLYLCDLFRTSDAGASWTGPIEAYGGDKAWVAIDRTGGPGDRYFYAAWDWAGCCGNDVYTRSIDQGGTFLAPIPVPGIPAWGTLAIDPDGALYVAGNNNGDLATLMVAKSSNSQNGLIVPTWDFTRVVSLGGSQRYFLASSPNPGGLLGQVWIAADHSDGPTRGNLYMLCSVNPPGPDPMDVMFARSEDGGQTWSAPVKVNSEPSGANAWQWFATMGVAPNGRIDVVWADTLDMPSFRVSTLKYSFSSDAGVTWSAAVQIAPQFDSWLGWPNQNKLGDYYDIESDLVGAHLAYAATYNGEQDVYYLRIGDYDCNGNGVGDAGDIAGGSSQDANGNGIPDECECVGDVDGDLTIGQSDLGVLLAAYGSAAGEPAYDRWADLDDSGAIDQADLGILLAAYGTACP